DCKPSFFVTQNERELRDLVEFMQSASEQHTPGLDPAHRQARTEQYLRNRDQVRRDLLSASAATWGQMDRCFRLYCLTTKPDCPLMWGHYADHHRGVCLEFDAHSPDFRKAIEVDYSAEYPKYSLAERTDISPFHSKSADWSYEQEYRLIAQEA